jgi:hypothetical protein
VGVLSCPAAATALIATTPHRPAALPPCRPAALPVPTRSPHRFASLRTASHRFAPLRTASHRFAPLRTASHRFAPLRIASHRFADHGEHVQTLQPMPWTR